MKKDQNILGSTRRSFLKKSTVAAVAASSVTIFSGLVNAAEAEGSGCKLVKVAGPQGVCKGWDDRDWYSSSTRDGQSIFGCIVSCSPANNNPNAHGEGTFLVVCTPNGVPVNNGWYSGTKGCKGPTDHTKPAN